MCINDPYLKPKNKKEFNRSFLRFYSMWILTTLIALVPLTIMFRVPGDENKRLRYELSSNKTESVEVDNLVATVDSIITLTENIKRYKSGESIDDLKFYSEEIKMENKEMDKRCRMLAQSVFRLAESFDKEFEDIDETAKDDKAEIRKLTIQLEEAEHRIRMLQMNNQPQY